MIIEFSDRKKDILEAIITDFVETAEPVGSFTITRHYLKDVSSATVRNEMHELEQSGFITHPHTSSGRIPTDLGYRYYVDNIMETKTISGKEITLIKSGVKKIGRGVSEIIQGTLKAVSSLFNCISIFSTFSGNKRSVSGLSNVLKQPEFQTIDTARHIIETFEQEELISRILEEYSKTDPFTIRIGHENKFREIKDLSVIVTTHNIKGIDPGAIAIIGPTRMDYKRVATALKYISEELDTLINKEIINA